MSAFLLHSMNTPVKESYHIPLVGPPVCPLDTVSNDIIPPARTRHIRTTSGVRCKIKWRVAYSKIRILFSRQQQQRPKHRIKCFWTLNREQLQKPHNQCRCWCYQRKPLRAEVAAVTHVSPRCRSVSLCTWNIKMVDEWMREQMSRGKRSP